MKTMTENIAGACVCSMRIEFNLCHNVQFNRFRYLLSVGQSKNHQNGVGDENRLMGFRWQRIFLETH